MHLIYTISRKRNKNVTVMGRFCYRIFFFLFGIIIGILLGKYCTHLEENRNSIHSGNPLYNIWFHNNKLKRQNVIWDTLRYNKSFVPVIESDVLLKKISVTCIILLKNIKNEQPIRNTWAKGCTDLRFIKLPKRKTIPLKRNLMNSSWVTLCQEMQDVKQSDWVLIVSDYTFVIMENLRFYLAPYIPNDVYYLGHAVKFWSTIYNSKQGGILLSNGTLSVFKKSVLNCSSLAYQNREDFYLGKTLATLGIRPIDTRDFDNLSRFYPFNLNALVLKNEYHKQTLVFPFKCCSKDLISFQAIDSYSMYVYYYVLYTLQLFTYGKLGNKANLQNKDNQVWQNFVKEMNISNNKITNQEYYDLWKKVLDDPYIFSKKMKNQVTDDV